MLSRSAGRKAEIMIQLHRKFQFSPPKSFQHIKKKRSKQTPLPHFLNAASCCVSGSHDAVGIPDVSNGILLHLWPPNGTKPSFCSPLKNLVTSSLSSNSQKHKTKPFSWNWRLFFYFKAECCTVGLIMSHHRSDDAHQWNYLQQISFLAASCEGGKEMNTFAVWSFKAPQNT